MTINQLTTKARDKRNFLTLQGYLDFCQYYLDYVAVPGNLQAVIVSRNENHYCFWQYDSTAGYQVTRPINSQLMYKAVEFESIRHSLLPTLRSLYEGDTPAESRSSLNNTIYTLQRSIGAALDGLPAGESNTARKLNGDLFERLIQLVLQEMGVDALAGTVRVPVVVDAQEQFKMNYQHDLIISRNDVVKVIGSVKTTSKDRIDKIFMDKFLYSKLTGSQLPHIAIFLNDVQRKGKLPDFGISSTFLPGHFKGYAVKLNPLDGVYYCDIRPNMKTEPILKDHIKTLDHLLCTDIWAFLQRPELASLEITPEE